MASSKRNRKANQTVEAVGAGDTPERLTAKSEGENTRQFHIVGIGASAGGLDAFTTFLKAVSPKLGMAFVLVPHLDPYHESALTQILARSTSMPVLQVRNEMRVEPDHVYIVPPNCDLTIQDGALRISDRAQPRSVNTTVDIFLRSLATEAGPYAIGVILSGTASDGTLGMTAIKSEGGITFAQDIRTAKYEGMPASAIAAGCVDMVMPPEEIARELERIARHPLVAGSQPGAIEEGAADTYMGQIFRLLRRVNKVDFSEYKRPTISRRIQRRMVLHRIEKLSDYVALMHRDRQEVNALYQDLLINVTSFFRNPEAFEALKQNVYPPILAARGSSHAPVRIWVPGCSTGEEAYSQAITLVEFLGEERIEIPIQIFGTDLSDAAIQRARAGIYREVIEADVSPVRLRRFFHKTDTGYQISKTIRDLCVFSTQNVFNDPPFSRIDLVSCRNVMIYLSQSLQKKVIPIFHYALNPSGFLMIGTTEGLLGAGSELFELVDKKQKIYQKRLVSTPVTFGFSVGHPEPEAEGAEPPPPPPKQTEATKVPLEMQREADRLLLARYSPPAVVINEHLEIVQSRGRTGSFLELPAVKASLNLLKMARPGLLFELQSALEEARRSGAETKRENVHVEDENGTKLTNVRVIPFRTPVQEHNSFLTVFEPILPEPGAPRLPVPSEQPEKDKQIAQLKQELAATKEYLQSIIESQEATNEELQSANEEIQSGNEELQSTNEELQTSKEELESANEELHTVNEEMQHRNELLTKLNNDLTNLLNSINLAMVMIGPDLSVRRFTPQATAILGLMPSDVGRPIPRLKLKIDSASLEQRMLDVIQEVQAKQYDVQGLEGKWFRLRITPYRTLDNRIEGVVLTIVDIGDDGGPNGAAAASPKKKAATQTKRR